MSVRPERVATAIKREVAKILLEEMRDPRIGFATVTEARLTADLKFCTIFISVLGDPKVKKGSLIAINHAKGFIRKLIGGRVELRFVPEIRFELDETAEHSQHIAEIFRKIDSEKRKEEDGDK